MTMCALFVGYKGLQGQKGHKGREGENGSRKGRMQGQNIKAGKANRGRGIILLLR